MNAGAAVETAFVCRSLLTTSDARRVVEKVEQSFGPFGAAIELVEVGERAFSKVAFGDRSDGVLLVVGVPQRGLGDIALPAAPLVIVTEDVEKPGNLGAVLRSADGAGADAVIAADPRTDLYNPNTIRASLGTIFALRLAAAPSPTVLDWCRTHGLRLVAARVDGAILHTDANLRGPVAIVLGSEAAGLSDAWRGPDVIPVRLPMHGVADSLNVSVAGAVVLYEALRQRGRGRTTG